MPFGLSIGFEGRSKLSTWLYRIAYNASLMRLRKRKQMTTFSLDQPSSAEDEMDHHESRYLVDWSQLPDDQLLTAEARREMERAIADLPETLRSTFVLRDVQGLSGAETAEVLGITVQAVKNRLHRARLRLRDRLSELFRRASRGPAGRGLEEGDHLCQTAHNHGACRELLDQAF